MARSCLSVRIYGLRLTRRLKCLVLLVVCCSICYFAFTILFNRHDIAVTNSSGENLTDKVTPGLLTLSIWRNVCGNRVEVLKNWPFYPSFPDKKALINVAEFNIEDNAEDYGQTITGFVLSPKSGRYRFAIASDDSSEFWLSSSKNPKEKRLIARVYSQETDDGWTVKNELNKYLSQVSNEINLRNGNQYYIEVIHKQGSGAGFVQVFWQGPGDTGFKLISSEFISPYSDDITTISTKEALSQMLNMRLDNSKAARLNYRRFLSLPDINEGNYLSPCTYESSFIVDEQIKIEFGNGLKLVHLSNVFPQDDTFMGKSKTVFSVSSWGNGVADANVVQLVVEKMIAAVCKKASKEYYLKRIRDVVQKPDPVYGDRFLVDLEVGLRYTNQSFRLTEHVYQKKGSAEPCLPQGIRWNNNATVYFIIPVKNQGKWVYHFINELSFASSMTGDTNFHVIIVDFQSEDISMTEAFQTPLLKNRHTIVNISGKFYKTLALNEGANKVPGTHDILFLFELHMDVPVNILDTARKNTIEGRIAYFPIVGHLDCNSSSKEHKGFWKMKEYGLLSIYKSDWDRFGGKNTNDFLYNMGGEDWGLLSRVMNAKLEVERVKLPGLYQHYHKTGK